MRNVHIDKLPQGLGTLCKICRGDDTSLPLFEVAWASGLFEVHLHCAEELLAAMKKVDDHRRRLR